MAKSNITPEKLAAVAQMVAKQKAAAEAAKGTKKVLKTAPATKVSNKVTKDVDAEKAAKQAERDARKAARDAERGVKKALLETKRAEKKAEREAVKAAKLAEKSTKAPSWQRKIERLEAALPTATENLKSLSDVIKNFSDVELTSALAFVEFERRVRGIRATASLKAEQGQVLNVGDKVLINNCNARKFIGQVGVVSLVRRIRAFVTVPGYDTEAYVFTSDVEVLEPAGVEELGNNILDGDDSEESEETETEESTDLHAPDEVVADEAPESATGTEG